MPCVIKYTHEDGVELPRHKQILWCGRPRAAFDFCFIDAQHAALADKPICKSCKAKIIEALNGEKE